MSSAQIAANGKTFSVRKRLFMMACDLFDNYPDLLEAPYPLRSRVSTPSFEEFLSAIEGNSATVTESNYADLNLLCKEFGYSGLVNQLSAFAQSHPSADCAISEMQSRVPELEVELNGEREYNVKLLDSLQS
jgi:hypothetical protein